MLTDDSRIIIQGSIADPLVTRTIDRMRSCSHNLVGIIDPAAEIDRFNDLPVFALVEEAIIALDNIDCSLIFVPPFDVLDAAREAISAKIWQISIVSSGVPPLDIIDLFRQAEITQTQILGAGSAGIIIPDRLLVGTYDPQLFKPGKLGIISRSYSPLIEITDALHHDRFGESIVIHLGSDRTICSRCDRYLDWLKTNPQTEAVILVGDIWWDDEAIVSEYLSNYPKPIITYLPGLAANLPRSVGNDPIVLSYDLSKPINDLDTLQQRQQTYNLLQIPIAHKIGDIPQIISNLLPSS
jgi:succinyl-CoA synthetase alpha subunit